MDGFIMSNFLYLTFVLYLTSDMIQVHASFKKINENSNKSMYSARQKGCQATKKTNLECMFTLDCMRAKGEPIGICMDGMFVRTCCELPFPSSVTDAHIKSSTTSSTTAANTESTLVNTEAPKTTESSFIFSSTQKINSTTVVSLKPDNNTVATEVPEILTTNNLIKNDITSGTTLKSNAASLEDKQTTLAATLRQEDTTTSVNRAASGSNTDELSFSQTDSIATTQSTIWKETSPKIVTSSTTPNSTTVSSSTTDHRAPVVGSISESSTTSKPAGLRNICGRRLTAPKGRIVGGTQSSFLEWPWMVSLRQWKKHSYLHKCGAALINEHWAITAAHCVENVPPTNLLLRLGEYDVSNELEPYPHLERKVMIVVPHPQFDPRTFEYDLALLRFVEPVLFRRNIIPVCIPEGNKSFVGQWATVTGWGRLYEDGPLPDKLQHVELPVITNKECESMYRNAGYIEDIPNIFICAGLAKGSKDSCEGDSGGPLVLEENGQFKLIGIISWGIGCALPNQPGVYTRITEFTQWIKQITGF